jgi:hypothetical protein
MQRRSHRLDEDEPRKRRAVAKTSRWRETQSGETAFTTGAQRHEGDCVTSGAATWGDGIEEQAREVGDHVPLPCDVV